ncbi:MAG: N-acetylmuramoyl-L-alanine amidase [Clostridium sp.]|jgi:hypothetical protein|nr:N-acetylmuramoyl-L-alanine amidase [Clostridium sp.]
MSNSPLVVYTKLSPNHSGKRNHVIDTITIHCVVGQVTAEGLGGCFAQSSAQASSNYGVDKDGRVGMYVEECNRSWCTSSGANDHRAVTIEVASDTKEPYAVGAKAYAGLLDLVTDICKRNGIKKLIWSTNKNSRVNHLNGCNMTVHRDYANKSCPGNYLYGKHGEIAAEVNKRLGAADSAPTKPATPSGAYKAGDVAQFNGGEVYTSANAATAAATKGASKVKITRVYDGKHPYHAISDDGKGVDGWVDASTLSAIGAAAPAAFTPYTVVVTADTLNYRSGAGTNYPVKGTVKKGEVYTIVAEASGAGSAKGWGKLKSGAGWISLDYCQKR